jgi:WhiB family redox-sensing transcriptional regulator
VKLGWKDQALCRQDPGGHWDGDLLPSMFQMCMSCPVKMECLVEALDHEERSDAGVWGGTSPEQRRAIRKGYDPYEVWRETRLDMWMEYQ